MIRDIDEMDIRQAADEIQRMHETMTVRRESIIAWYDYCSRKLPKMRPERSDVDLIRTVALWMELTDRGGSPAFPYEYKSDLRFRSIDPTTPAKPNISWLLGCISILAGIATLFLNWKLGSAFIVAGPLIQYTAYRLSGGPTNPNLMKQGTTLYEKEGKQVLEWATQQSLTTL